MTYVEMILKYTHFLLEHLDDVSLGCLGRGQCHTFGCSGGNVKHLHKPWVREHLNWLE
jgi:hypothetical protein